MIQSHTPVRIGTGGAPNLVGAWEVIIPQVTAQSTWSLLHWWFVDVGPLVVVIGTINMELGIGTVGIDPNDPGATERVWKSLIGFGGGSELEFDDSGFTKYLPFNFPRDSQVSGRLARIGSVDSNLEIQLQLYS